ncbi:reverse transcriptase-like protein [Elysia marginata]|uniref:Reverse transcriptase-like protein n=1 Tax=Elysia marginata TaxID=1093978 RepID=A0AAV4IPS3_9GAST|nr:reverse transcriptase-like protein [Elysia marginata]
MLVLLDLSAAFDTVDQDCIDPTAVSSSTCLKFGVPQGSVLGPILFTLYTAPLSDIIKAQGMTFHLYADVTQLYISAKPGEELSTISLMHTCCESVRKWMKQNKLK